MCAIMQTFMAIGQNVAEIWHFSIQNGSHLPAWICNNWKCYLPVRFRASKCVIVPSLAKIDLTVAETRRFNGFNMAAIRHLGFSKI